MSNFFKFGMRGPLDESIFCFLIRVDPWVLVSSPLEGCTPSPLEDYTSSPLEDYTSSPS